jgi:aryl-alcohol dehydrogenase-like predicted oxidoreductase
MNKFILGTAQFGLNYGINNQNGKPNKSTVDQILNLAYQLGINTLDTADAYGTSHAIIGNYHRDYKFNFKINTKFTSAKNKEFVDKVKNACEILQVEKLNTCFYHNYLDYFNGTLNPYLNELMELRLINEVGVSIYTNEEFEVVINDPLINTIQLPFNLFDNFNQRGDLILKAKKNGKTIQVRSVYLQGLFFLNPKSLNGNLAELANDLDILNNIVSDFNISMSDLCLQYVLFYKEIDHIIIGVDSSEQLISNLNAFKKIINTEIIDRVNSICIKNQSLLYPYNWK